MYFHIFRIIKCLVSFKPQLQNSKREWQALTNTEDQDEWFIETLLQTVAWQFQNAVQMRLECLQMLLSDHEMLSVP